MAVSTRAHFDKQLSQLREDVLMLGSRARRAVAESLTALTSSDADLAREVVAADVGINRQRYDIEFRCYLLLATEQPVASDMRSIASGLILANELERVADHGKKIAATYLRMLEDPVSMDLGEIPDLGSFCLTMIDRALRAFATRNVSEAEAVCRSDDQADAKYKQAFDAIVKGMVDDPRRISAGTHLLQIAHELERVGDRATNIAERVIYSVTGELIELNVG